MNDHPSLSLIPQNLVRLTVFEYLAEFDPAAGNLFPQLFAEWTSKDESYESSEKHPVHRLCDFLLAHYSDSPTVGKPSPEKLSEVYSNSCSKSDEPGIHRKDAGRKEADNPARIEEIITLLRNEGFTPGIVDGMPILQSAALAVELRLNTLLQGEQAVGKRRLARLIHRLGSDKENPLIFIAASDLSPAVASSRMKEGGTLVISEIGELCPETQTALREAMHHPDGLNLSRVISTSSQDVARLVEEKVFDRLLFYQLSIINVFLPPLNERLPDLEELAGYFIQRFRRSNRKFSAEKLSSEALKKLKNHPWHGNLQELQSVMRLAMMNCPDRVIGQEHIVFPAEIP